MKHMLKTFAILLISAVAIISCKKEIKSNTEVSQAVKDQIQQMGFGTSNVQKVDDGYLVEGDIVITPEVLNSNPQLTFLRVGDEEQYRTTNLVTGLPRTITVRVSTSLPSSYVTNTDAAIARYNAQNLLLHFQRVTSGGNILITPAPGGASYLASSGFPSGGNPYSKVLVNRTYLDTWNANTVVSILCHEMGHCIGFRHTDYMNRAYSCGGSPVNEGASTVGAIHIPGTPTGPDPNSWMLACIGNGVNRPFNSNDRTALNYLY